MAASTIIISVCLFTLIAYVCKMVYSLWLGPKMVEKCLRKQGFKGNSYRFLYGDSKEIMSMMKQSQSTSIETSVDDMTPHVLPYYHHFTKLFGENYFIWMGTTPRINIVDPELVKDILALYEIFHKPKVNALGKLFVLGIVAQEGENWVKHRTLLNPTFHLQKIKLLVPAMYLSCSEMLNKLEELLGKKESCEVDMHPYLNNMTAEIISRTTFSSNYEEGRKIFQLHREQSSIVTELMESLYIPGWRFLPTRDNKRIKEVHCEMHKLLSGIIERRENALRRGEEINDDMLGTLLKTNRKERLRSKRNALSIEEISNECKIFYEAGQETTSLLLSWTMVLLSKHQKWQDRAREEVKLVFGDNEPNLDGLSHLKVLTMILNEVLRLYPPLTTLYRATHKKTRLGKYDLPAGTEISVPVMAIHTDPKLWGDDAKEFNPGRFSEGISKASFKQGVFFPMSAGPRICIGQNFAMLEAKLVFAMILQKFSFQLSPNYIHSPSPTFMLVKPQYGVRVILKKA